MGQGIARCKEMQYIKQQQQQNCQYTIFMYIYVYMRQNIFLGPVGFGKVG